MPLGASSQKPATATGCLPRRSPIHAPPGVVNIALTLRAVAVIHFVLLTSSGAAWLSPARQPPSSSRGLGLHLWSSSQTSGQQ